jgi:hypothetical protein
VIVHWNTHRRGKNKTRVAIVKTHDAQAISLLCSLQARDTALRQRLATSHEPCSIWRGWLNAQAPCLLSPPCPIAVRHQASWPQVCFRSQFHTHVLREYNILFLYQPTTFVIQTKLHLTSLPSARTLPLCSPAHQATRMCLGGLINTVLPS